MVGGFGSLPLKEVFMEFVCDFDFANSIDSVIDEIFEPLDIPAVDAIQELIMRVGMIRCLESLGLIDNEHLNECKTRLKEAIAECMKIIRKNGKKVNGVFYYEFR